MAKSPKTQFGKKKGGNESGTKINHTVSGNPVSGYAVNNSNGEVVSENIELMWDAIELKKGFDRGEVS